MKVRFSREAENDLDAIAEWIGEDNPHRSVTFLLELRDRCQSLGAHPKRFPIVQNLAGQPIRKLVHNDYLIFYTVGDAVEVVRIVHGSRDWAALLGFKD